MQTLHAKHRAGANGVHRRRVPSESAPPSATVLPGLVLRPGGSSDLEAVNRVIDAAVMGWDLPERVKRLSLPTYRYGAHDLEHLDLIVAVDDAGRVVGVAALEAADASDAPGGSRALLLHGLYVLPERQVGGVGRLLARAAEDFSAEGGWDGLLAKAQPSAAGFFGSLGFERLPVRDPGRDYPHRFWRALHRREGAAAPRATVPVRSSL